MDRSTPLLSTIAYLSLGAALLAILAVGNAFYVPDKQIQTAAVENAIPESTKNDPFLGIELEARAAYVYDVNQDQVLFSKNPDIQLPLASLTKVMTALTAKDLIPTGSKVTISKKILKEDGDGTLSLGEAWKFEDLLDFTLVKSSNDGAVAIAGALGAVLNEESFEKSREAFIEAMNVKARQLGLAQTYFVNETGLDVGPVTAGNQGSARDAAVLFTAALKAFPDAFEATRYTSISVDSFKKKHTAKNTNKRVEEIPGIIASKTGSTDLAGGNLVVAFEAGPNRPIVVSVLGSSNEGRFDDVLSLVWATLEREE